MEQYLYEYESKGSPASLRATLIWLAIAVVSTAYLVIALPSMCEGLFHPGGVLDKAGTVCFVITGPVVVLCLYWLAWHGYEKRQSWLRLHQHGIPGRARIVGHQRIEPAEGPDEYYIYYQFQPQFKVKHQDHSPERRYHSLPEGAEIEILYLKDKPHISVPL